MRAENIRAAHRRNGRVCAGCGQSWPCTEIAWANDIPLSVATLRRRKLRALVLLAAIPLTIVGAPYLPTWALVALFFVGIPVGGLVLLVVASGRRP